MLGFVSLYQHSVPADRSQRPPRSTAPNGTKSHRACPVLVGSLWSGFWSERGPMGHRACPALAHAL